MREVHKKTAGVEGEGEGGRREEARMTNNWKRIKKARKEENTKKELMK